MTVHIRETTSNPAQNPNGNSSNGLLGDKTSSSFMQLLMTELRSQDPMAPMNTDTFVSQLVNLNMLDQVSQINQNVKALTLPEVPSGS